MTPSRQLTSSTRIGHAKAVLHAAGYIISESHPYSAVHRVHETDSFHYVTQGGQTLAADINWPNRSEEPRKLVWAQKVCQSYGLGFIRNSAGHYDHMHTDSGSYYRVNNSRWTLVRPMTDLRAYRTERLQAATRVKVTNLWSSYLDKRLNAVYRASRMGGVKFPYGIKYTQAVIGAKQTGKWDAQSRLAHDKCVKKIEVALGMHNANSIWDKNTSNAIKTAKKEAVKS